MKNLMISTVAVIMILGAFMVPVDSNAQFGRILKDRVQQKVERKIEDKIIEELSEEIARRAFKPIEKSLDDFFKSTFESEEGDSIDWEKAGEAYSRFLMGMNKAANVPDKYSFDYTLDVEIEDYEDNKHNMRYFFSKSGNLLGLQEISSEKRDIVVFDNENDVMVVYSTDKNGNKTAQAMPSVMKLASAFAGKHVKEEMEKSDYDIKKTGKTKKVIGYVCDEYLIESAEDKSTAYVSSSFPVSFSKAFGEAFNKFLPDNYKNTSEMMTGMALMSIHQSKEDKKQKSTFEAKKFSETLTVFDNIEYGLKENQ